MAFTAFLVSEFSEENIAFYVACEDFRSTKSAAKLAAKAQRIYDEFICTDAPREVCIPQKLALFSLTNEISMASQFQSSLLQL